MDLEVSAELRHGPAKDWIQQVAETSSLLGGLTAIINPGVYRAGMECVKKIQSNPELIAKGEDLLQILRYWTSPYTTVSLISNRNSPLHRDNGGGYASMDLLISVGEYKDGWFQVPGLGYNVFYNSGTAIAIAGRVVVHGARAEGERLVWAQYLKENILGELDVHEPDWIQIADLL